MSNKTCAIIAEPPMCFKWGLDEEDERCCALKLLLINRLSLLQTEGIMQFYVPLDDGIGIYCAEILLSLRETNPKITINCIEPYEDQAVKWPPNLRDRYFEVTEKCSTCIPVSLIQTMTCDLDAMLGAIDQSSIVLAVKADESLQDKTFATAFRYAERIGREIITIAPPKIEF